MTNPNSNICFTQIESNLIRDDERIASIKVFLKCLNHLEI